MHHVQEWSQQSRTFSKLGLYNSHSFYSNYYPGSSWDGMDSFLGGQLYSETKLLYCKMYEQELIRKVVHFWGYSRAQMAVDGWEQEWFIKYLAEQLIVEQLLGYKAQRCQTENGPESKTHDSDKFHGWLGIAVPWFGNVSTVVRHPHGSVREQRSACQEHGAMSCVQCVPPNHETYRSASGRSHSLAQGGSLCIRNIECFSLCLVCCGGCVAMSGATMDTGSHGGNPNGSGSIRSLIPVILISEGTLIMVI